MKWDKFNLPKKAIQVMVGTSDEVTITSVKNTGLFAKHSFGTIRVNVLKNVTAICLLLMLAIYWIHYSNLFHFQRNFYIHVFSFPLSFASAS